MPDTRNLLGFESSGDYLTVNEIAETLKLNPQTVRNWIDRGELRAVRVGSRRVRVLRTDLDAYIAQGFTDASASAPEQESLSATPETIEQSISQLLSEMRELRSRIEALERDRAADDDPIDTASDL